MCLSFSSQTPASPPVQMETSVFRQTTLISANWMTQNEETKEIQMSGSLNVTWNLPA